MTYRPVRSLQAGTEVGIPSVAGNEVVVDYTSQWGITAADVAYFDEVAVDAGDEAIATYDEATGAVVLQRIVPM